MWLLPMVLGCNLAFGIDDLEVSERTSAATTGAAMTVSASSHGSTGGSIGMAGSGGTGEGGSGGMPLPAKRVFVSSESTTGDLDGYAGGDLFCQRLGQVLGPSVWRAWLSDGTHAAIDALVDVGPWFLVNDGPQVAANKAQLATGVLDHPIDRDENDRQVDMKGVWTGTEANGTVSGSTNHHCDNWTTSSSGVGAQYGLTDQVDPDWTEAGQVACAVGARLYCFEQ